MQNFWCIDLGEYWRKWKQKQDWPEAPETPQWKLYEKEMETRKIAKKEGLDILRWCYRIKGMFTIKEGYQLQVECLRHQETNT